MDRKKRFNIILAQKNVARKELATKLGLKVDSLNKKIYGISLFNENQIKIILKHLDIKFEDLFI